MPGSVPPSLPFTYATALLQLARQEQLDLAAGKEKKKKKITAQGWLMCRS